MPPQRFLTLDDVAEVLNVSWRQAYALVRSQELPAIQVGGRNQWRVEISQLDAYIERKYAEAAKNVERQDVSSVDSLSDSDPGS